MTENWGVVRRQWDSGHRKIAVWELKPRYTNFLRDSTFKRLVQSPEQMGSRGQAPAGGSGGWSPGTLLGFSNILGPKSAFWGPSTFSQNLKKKLFYFFWCPWLFLGVALPHSHGFRSPGEINVGDPQPHFSVLSVKDPTVILGCFTCFHSTLLRLCKPRITRMWKILWKCRSWLRI